jgi:predicted  nucleic acid-binding Zn-ribbon protein
MSIREIQNLHNELADLECALVQQGNAVNYFGEQLAHAERDGLDSVSDLRVELADAEQHMEGYEAEIRWIRRRLAELEGE